MTITLIAAALTLQSAAPVPPPIFDSVPGQQQQLLRWTRSPVLCRDADGGVAAAPPIVRDADPQRSLAWPFPGTKRTVTFDFRIDASGRPLSITRAATTYIANAEDVAPAFAASRFASGIERSRCTVTFTASLTPIAAAPIGDVMAYSVFPSGPPPRTLWTRLRPPGSTCVDPTPDVLLRAFPAFKALPDQPGYRTWSMTGYDLAASGKPRNIRTIAGSGTPALDQAARQAVARSRFERGARTGCLYPYYKGAAILPAPIPPEEDTVRSVKATCPRHGWDRAPVLVYPANYQRRSIEGWAMVTYDVAPWGQTGNIRVLQAEPTADFGEAATTMIRNATLPPSDTGYIGCVDRVRYVIGKPGITVPNAPETID